MLPGEPGAVAPEDRVVRQIFIAQLAGVRPAEVAKVVLQLEATARHPDRRKGRIALGRDVPVIGQAELQAARRGLRVIRREESAATLALERKCRVRKSEQRMVEEAQPRVIGFALIGVVVEIDLARLQHPVVLPGLAGRVARVDEPIAVFAQEFHAVRGTARRRLAVEQEARALEYAGVVERVVLDARPEEAIDAALQPHAAGALELAELAVVAQELAEDGHLAAADLGRAARAHLEVAHALDLLRIDGGRFRLLPERASRGGQRDRQRREAG